MMMMGFMHEVLIIISLIAFKVRKYEIWDVVNVPALPNQENPGETKGRPTIILEDLETSAVIFPTKKIDRPGIKI